MDTNNTKTPEQLRDELSELIKTEYGYFIRYAASRVRDREMAQEIVSVMSLRALENLDTFRGDSSMKTWLCSILFSIIINESKSKRRSQFYSKAQALGVKVSADQADAMMTDSVTLETAAQQVIAESAVRSSEEIIEGNQLQEAIECAVVRSLRDPIELLVFRAYFQGERSLEEICDLTGFSEKEIRGMIKSIRLRMAKELIRVKAEDIY